MTITIYHYPRCGTCRKAIKWLEEHGKALNKIDITLNPPSADQLRKWKDEAGLDLKTFFNTSGQVYRELNLKDKREQMSEEEQLDLLASNGKLIKRPIVTDGKQVTVGFREAEFEKVWQ